MDCRLNREALWGWHMGVADSESDARVEAHLLECTECLQRLFVMRRSSFDGGQSPSVAVEARLKAAVTKEFAVRRAVGGPSEGRRTHVRWGVAAAAAGAALVLGAQWAARGTGAVHSEVRREAVVRHDVTNEDGFETDSARGFEPQSSSEVGSVGVL